MIQSNDEIHKMAQKSEATINLKFRNFCIAFGANVIFSNFEYEFYPGIYVFSGTSGVGKTTLMRCIAGLERHYTGEICLNGEVLEGTTPDIHMVHQHYTSFPWLNCLNNVLMVHKGHKIKITQEYISEAKDMLVRFGLEDHINKLPSQISGGQDQRVSLCSAFVNHWSKVLLYDEPSSALDLDNTKLLAELLKEHQSIHNTIEIVTTHDQDLIEVLNPVTIEFTPDFRLRTISERNDNCEGESVIG